MKIYIFIVSMTLCFVGSSNAEDYKEDVVKKFENVSKELNSEEQKLIEITPKEGKEKLKNAFKVWREWVKLYLDSKYSGSEGKGSVTPYIRMDENGDLYRSQITWLKATIEEKSKVSK